MFFVFGHVSVLRPSGRLYRFIPTFAAQTERVMYQIKVTFEQEGREPILLNNVAASQSLLEICLDNGIELQHRCGASCACSTCHVYVVAGMTFLSGVTCREEDFVERADNPRPESRLGCQCTLLPGTGDMEIMVPDQRRFIREEEGILL